MILIIQSTPIANDVQDLIGQIIISIVIVRLSFTGSMHFACTIYIIYLIIP